MSKAMRWSSLAMALGLSLMLPLGVFAQSDDAGENIIIPELEGLAW